MADVVGEVVADNHRDAVESGRDRRCRVAVACKDDFGSIVGGGDDQRLKDSKRGNAGGEIVQVAQDFWTVITLPAART